MYSSRKSSVKRHIQTKHEGNVKFVYFVDYSAGRKIRYYWPSLPPTYQKKNNESSNKKMMADYMNMMNQEVGGNALDKKCDLS